MLNFEMKVLTKVKFSLNNQSTRIY